MSLAAPLILVIALVGLTPAAASAAYRCTDGKGRVTYQDFPCEGSTAQPGPPAGDATRPVISPAPKPPTTGTTPARDPAYSTARGEWRGPAQMHFTSGGQRDLTAHRVTPIVIEVGNDGKVRGLLSGAGCKISGLGSQFVQPSIASLDVTVTGCTDERFNGRYQGHLSAFQGSRETKLNLSRVGMTKMPQGEVQTASIEAVLRR